MINEFVEAVSNLVAEQLNRQVTKNASAAKTDKGATHEIQIHGSTVLRPTNSTHFTVITDGTSFAYKIGSGARGARFTSRPFPDVATMCRYMPDTHLAALTLLLLDVRESEIEGDALVDV